MTPYTEDQARAASDACERFFTVANDGSWLLRPNVEVDAIARAALTAALAACTPAKSEGR